ncbi:MAG: ribose-phosphate diphosphokinase [Raineya sp.]|nr:ribose-phosphate diphosphokinase [Raineya sp.]
MAEPLLFSIQSYLYLQEKLLQLGDFRKGEVEVKTFPDGERYQRILNNVEGEHVILLGGTPTDTDTLELYDLASAISMYGAKNLTIVVPYFGYSTMERAVKKGEVVTAKTRAKLLSAIPKIGSRITFVLMDLHTEGLPHYFEGDVQAVHLYCKEVIMQACREMAGTDFILACTDAGRAKWVESLANDMGVLAAFVFKRRVSGEETIVTGISADVAGKNVIIYDDMIRTGGSLINAAKSYKEAGANRIFAITTHGLFSNNALQRLQQSQLFEKIYCTDTHPNSQKENANSFLVVKSVAEIIKKRIFSNS